MSFFCIHISQGSVATRLGCGNFFVHDFVTNFLRSLTVKELWKSSNIWWSYGQEFGVLFFLTHGVHKWHMNIITTDTYWTRLLEFLDLSWRLKVATEDSMMTSLFKADRIELKSSWWAIHLSACCWVQPIPTVDNRLQNKYRTRLFSARIFMSYIIYTLQQALIIN